MSVNVEKNFWLEVFREILDYQDCDSTKKNQRFFNTKLLYKCYVLDWVHAGGI